MKTLDKILFVVGIFLLTYTAVVLILFSRMGMEPTVLTGCVFAACIGEGSICCSIWKQKEKRQDRDWQKEDMAEAERKAKEMEERHESHRNPDGMV